MATYKEHLQVGVTRFEAYFLFTRFVVLENLPNPLSLSYLSGKNGNHTYLGWKNVLADCKARGTQLVSGGSSCF